MKAHKLCPLLLVIFWVVQANAQPTSQLQLNIPDRLTSKELGDKGYTAYELQSLSPQSYTGTWSFLTGSDFLPDQTEIRRLRFLQQPIFWSKLENEHIGPSEYLIAYKAEFDWNPMAAVSAGKSHPHEFSFRLFLIRLDSIAVIAPRPNITLRIFLADAASDGFLESSTDAGPPKLPADFEIYRQRALHAEDLSHIKQLALGIIMYQNDFDDNYPYVESSRDLKPLLRPYLKGNDLWQTMNPAGSEYYFNMSLAGANAMALPEPAKTPLFFESRPWGDGVRAVAFADGHAKLEPEPEWELMADRLKLKLKRNGKPLPVPK